MIFRRFKLGEGLALMLFLTLLYLFLTGVGNRIVGQTYIVANAENYHPASLTLTRYRYDLHRREADATGVVAWAEGKRSVSIRGRNIYRIARITDHAGLAEEATKHSQYAVLYNPEAPENDLAGISVAVIDADLASYQGAWLKDMFILLPILLFNGVGIYQLLTPNRRKSRRRRD
ncbi:hypothetical protein GCM10007350_35530 [Jeongeupia chitinilytica]|uniref:DUF3592 domain-containing protein n=2 Tax=Jeongeupia chitinilytica TaxID=1041641 RepID=A0ABQ3H3Z7_9NEIS|nr:hypothetical protein GCM10007350_35530 [Jeongeupia chitinilytica]